jgi:hypothetical protein
MNVIEGYRTDGQEQDQATGIGSDGSPGDGEGDHRRYEQASGGG